MNIRKILVSLLGILLIAGAVITFKKITKKKAPKEVVAKKIVQSVVVSVVNNSDITVQIDATGKLSAKNKMDIFAEVQGVSQRASKEFKPGVKFYKGQTLIKINSDEFASSIKAKKSALQNVISAIMPDLRLDFPDAFQKWENYLNAFDINASLKALPSTSSNKEKYFISAKNISVKYYEIKNLEEKLRKFSIRAPFTGIVSQANVNTGTLINPGQKLGQFIDPSVYELEISLTNNAASLLKVGDNVKVKNIENTKLWNGTVIRKNAILDQTTQTKKVFIKLKGADLSDGMYLKAFINGSKLNQVYEIDRSLIVEDKFVYIVENRALKLKEINVIHFNEKTALVKGLLNGQVLVSKVVPGAYEGMEVSVIKN